jgi:hypothetical protein
MEGSQISYYIRAIDASGRKSNHPYIGAPDPHVFSVKVSAPANVTVTPDSLLFLTEADILNGKNVTVNNISPFKQIILSDVDNSGTSPFGWEIENWNLTLPYTMQPGESLNFKVKINIPIGKTAYRCDSMFINTPDFNNHVMICVDPVLFTKVNPTATTGYSVYPNPVQSNTSFIFTTEKEAEVSIEIFTMMGKLVSTPCNKKISAGQHSIVWEGKGTNNEKLLPGMYLYRITTGGKIVSGKIVIL